MGFGRQVAVVMMFRSCLQAFHVPSRKSCQAMRAWSLQQEKKRLLSFPVRVCRLGIEWEVRRWMEMVFVVRFGRAVPAGARVASSCCRRILHFNRCPTSTVLRNDHERPSLSPSQSTVSLLSVLLSRAQRPWPSLAYASAAALKHGGIGWRLLLWSCHILKGLRDQRPVREDFASCRWQEGVRPAQALKVGASACLGRTELIIDGSGSCDPELLSAPSLCISIVNSRALESEMK